MAHPRHTIGCIIAKHSRSALYVSALLAACGLVLLGCEGRAPVAPEQAVGAPRLELVQDAPTASVVGDTVLLIARVTTTGRNGKSAPLQSALVNWAVRSGGGSLYLSASLTDANGEARNRWVVGPTIGTQVVELRTINSVTGAGEVLASATANVTGFGPDWILFVSSRNGGQNIFRVRSDVSELVQLTANGSGGDYEPAWSPERGRIAWSRRNSYGAQSIWIANADGNAARQLTPDSLSASSASWSPDGTQIVHNCVGGGLCVITLGTGLTRRIPIPGDWASDPDWSPDGTSIAFIDSRIVTDPDGTTHWYSAIAVMNPDGSNVRVVASSAQSNFTPAWSPDGRLIAFSRSALDDPYKASIFVVNADGSGLRQVTDPVAPTGFQASDQGPSWSPDGTALVFTTWRQTDPPAVVLVRLDGSSRHLVFSNYSWDLDPDWR